MQYALCIGQAYGLCIGQAYGLYIGQAWLNSKKYTFSMWGWVQHNSDRLFPHPPGGSDVLHLYTEQALGWSRHQASAWLVAQPSKRLVGRASRPGGQAFPITLAAFKRGQAARLHLSSVATFKRDHAAQAAH
jgi:hypothetical protein